MNTPLFWSSVKWLLVDKGFIFVDTLSSNHFEILKRKVTDSSLSKYIANLRCIQVWKFQFQNNSPLISFPPHGLFSNHPFYLPVADNTCPCVSCYSTDLNKSLSSLSFLSCRCHVDLLHYCSSLRMWWKVQNQCPNTLLCLEVYKMSAFYRSFGMCQWFSFLYIIIPHWILKRKAASRQWSVSNIY